MQVAEELAAVLCFHKLEFCQHPQLLSFDTQHSKITSYPRINNTYSSTNSTYPQSQQIDQQHHPSTVDSNLSNLPPSTHHGRQSQSTPRKDPTPPSQRSRRPNLSHLLRRLSPRSIPRAPTQASLRPHRRHRMSLTVGVRAKRYFSNQMPTVHQTDHRSSWR